jgi:membrane associated rhomboid family serine protease
MQLDTTTIIIIITVLVSIGGFSNQKLVDDLIFYPPAVTQRKQWYRFITCGLIHADVAHLAFNMLSLYFFGKNVEKIFIGLLGKQTGILVYLLLYVSALAVSLLPTYSRHKNNYQYRSLGASGAVSAIIFAGLTLIPSSEVYIFFIPIPIPGFIFAPLFLLISFYLDRKGTDNINHSAHIWGSIYGVIFVIVMCYSVNYPVFENFIYQIKNYMRIKGWTS